MKYPESFQASQESTYLFVVLLWVGSPGQKVSEIVFSHTSVTSHLSFVTFCVLGLFLSLLWIGPELKRVVQQTPVVVVESCLDVPGAPRVQLSGKTFLRFPHLESIKREAAPSGEQRSFLFHACMCFWVLQMFMIKIHYRWGPLVGETWDKYSSPGQLHGILKSENYIQKHLSK